MTKYIILFLTAFSVLLSTAFAKKPEVSDAEQIYAYMFPLMIAYVSRDISTNVVMPTGTRAPLNQLGTASQLLNASFTDVISPNADTLYTMISIDTTNEPLVLSVPAIKDRYFLIPFLDEYSNSIGSFGTRTGETDATTYVIVGSDYKGKLPDSLKNAKIVRLNSNFALSIIRIQIFGDADTANVNKLQQQIKLVPLSAYGNPNYVPPKGVVNPNVTKMDPNDFVFSLNARDYYNRAFTYYNKSNPAKENKRFTKLLVKYGIVHGKTTSFDQLSPEVQKQLSESVVEIQTVVGDYLKTSNFQSLAQVGFYPRKRGEVKLINGWLYFPNTLADFGKDYSLRAMVVLAGYGANLNKDAVYSVVAVDSNNQPLVATKKYTVTMSAEAAKSAMAFWSITMYQKNLFVANALNKYTVSSWMPTLQKNADGSITFYIQTNSPGKDKEANWLPAPQSGNFSLMARLYWPSDSFLSGKTQLPAIVEVK